MERRLGGPQLAIRCAIDHLEGTSRTLGRVCFELGGAELGSFDQPCVLGGVAVDLDVTIHDIDTRKDLLLARADPREALERVYAAVYGPDASEESAFWHRRFVWLEGREPYDGFRSIMLAHPRGRLIAWDRDGSDFHQAVVGEEAYRRAIYELLAWLEHLGVGSYARPSCVACAFGLEAVRTRELERARRRLMAALGRERKARRTSPG